MADSVAVHRCRFVDFTPSAITALAFPPLPLPSIKGKKSTSGQKPLQFGTLAIGRANGNIEICEWTGNGTDVQAPQAWVVRKTLSGPRPSKVDSLAFTIRYSDKLGSDDVPATSDLRLFSSGGGSELIEWDLDRGCIRRTISSQGGSIWSIAANPASNVLALGCEDGSIRLLSLLYDTLEHNRRFDRVKCRILSLAWGPPIARKVSEAKKQDVDDSSDSNDDEDDWSDSWLVTGGSDSSLRKWDVATGRVLDRMSTDKMKGEKTLVWAVGVLGDGTIVSGDSLGTVKFWDPRTSTQLQSFNTHGADVLCLTVGPEGSTVYTSGVDQRVSQFSLTKATGQRASHRWIHTSSRRLHSHDVRALIVWPPYTPLPQQYKRQFPANIAPILVSGGLDMSVVVTPAALHLNNVANVVNPLATSAVSTFEDSYHRRLAYSSAPASTSALRVARMARLLLCMGDTELSIWRILPKKEEEAKYMEHEPKNSPAWEKVLEMELDVQTNLVASTISDNGRWVVASDMYETKLFSIENLENGDLKPKRIRDLSAIIKSHLPSSLGSTGGSAFCFSPDSLKLVMATTLAPHILVIDLSTDEKPCVLRRFDHHRTHLTPGDRLVKPIKKRSKNEKPESKVQSDEKPDGSDIEMNGDAGEMIEEDKEDESPKVHTTISRMAISSDGQWLATTDDLACTHIFNLDTVKHHCSLPSFPQPVHALAFNSVHSSTLVLGFPNNTFQIFDVEARQFPQWSRDLCQYPPRQFTHTHDSILGVTFDLRTSQSGPNLQSALFWGSTWLCQVKMEIIGKKKRRRLVNPLDDPSKNLKMINVYRPILFADFIAPGELVVVERPLVDILATLPPAYFKPKYGVS